MNAVDKVVVQMEMLNREVNATAGISCGSQPTTSLSTIASSSLMHRIDSRWLDMQLKGLRHLIENKSLTEFFDVGVLVKSHEANDKKSMALIDIVQQCCEDRYMNHTAEVHLNCDGGRR
ncbi:MAG: hypothetical protein ACI8XX_001666 [Polaribacter sp.]